MRLQNNVECPKQRYGNGATGRVKAEHVLKIVAAANGQVAAYEIRPDLPELFPHPTQGE
jgi:DNA-binding transcriptional regulator YdaS (Cro superfamily)